MRTERIIRTLVAAAPRSVEPIERALGAEHHITITNTLSHAKQLLTESTDSTELIVCGLYFDESRMFDLLRYVKADEKLRAIPFIAIKATDPALSRTLHQSIEIACGALGAEKFVELTEWEEHYGAEAAQTRFRALVARVVAS